VCVQVGVGNCVARFSCPNPILGIFWRALECKMLVHFILIWYIIHPFGIFSGNVVYFMVMWYILWPFGIHMYTFCDNLIYCFLFRYFVQRKIWQPWSGKEESL
jgi:hypothetical protein